MPVLTDFKVEKIVLDKILKDLNLGRYSFGFGKKSLCVNVAIKAISDSKTNEPPQIVILNLTILHHTVCHINCVHLHSSLHE